MRLTDLEKEKVWNALKFYIYETTHISKNTNEFSCISGLPNGKEKTILVRALKKIERDLK